MAPRGVVLLCHRLFAAVARGLRPEQKTAAMQSIALAVLNPWFFALFFGTALGSAALGAKNPSLALPKPGLC